MILGKKFINYKEFFHTHAHTNGLSCLPINKPFLSTMLKKIVLSHCLNWRKVNTAISDVKVTKSNNFSDIW